MKKILLIEDDDDTLELVSYVLNDSGFETIMFAHEITISDVVNINPQLVIIDYYLSTSLGSSFCLEIKNSPATMHLPVIMFSAANNLQEKAEKNCADTYVEKPFDIDELLRVVNQYIL
jgi:two-component system phosphate regulon response regulator PhoB